MWDRRNQEKCKSQVLTLSPKRRLHAPGGKTCRLNCLFMLNMSTGGLKIVPSFASTMICRLFFGFCNEFSLMYAHIALTTCGRDIVSTPKNACRASDSSIFRPSVFSLPSATRSIQSARVGSRRRGTELLLYHCNNNCSSVLLQEFYKTVAETVLTVLASPVQPSEHWQGSSPPWQAKHRQ
jgi:hypothetical protein